MARKYDSKATTEAILSVSARLFLEKGFDRISMKDIAREAKVSTGAIYHHFQSKDDILQAVLEKQKETVKLRLGDLLSGTSALTGKEQLVHILEKNIEMQEIHYLDDIISSRMKSAEFVLSYMQNSINNDAPLIAKIIQKGIDDGSLAAEHPDECAEVFLLLLNVWCDPAIFSCDEKKLSSRLYFLQGLMSSIGIDVLNDELIEKSLNLLGRLYFKEANHE